MDVTIRPLEEDDNAAIASVIRSVLTEFGANKPGTVFTDPTTDNLFELFKADNSMYYVAEFEGRILGGCGLYPTEGMPDGCIELVKLYLDPAVRGKGVGRRLMELCFEAARGFGYREIYLETLPELHIAVGLYEQLGFTYLNNPYGNSGHFACDLWMAKSL